MVLHVLAVLVAAMLFGTTGTAQVLGPDGTTPLSVGAMRLIVGGIAIAAITFPLAARRARRSPIPRPRATPWALTLMALTAVALAVYQPLFFLGTARNGVAVGTVVALGSAPVLAGVAEWMLTRRRPTATWIGATALATAGVVMLGFAGGGEAGGAHAGQRKHRGDQNNRATASHARMVGQPAAPPPVKCAARLSSWPLRVPR